MKKKYNKRKIIIFSLVLSIIIIFLTISLVSNKLNKVDCNKIHPIYIKASELNNSHEILKKDKNIIVVIPELNQLNANREVLNCENFDYSEFIN